jgi:hypothetical protein
MENKELLKPDFLQNQDLEDFLEEFKNHFEVLSSLGEAAIEVGFEMNHTFHSAVRVFGPIADKVKQYLEYSLQREVIENQESKAVYKITAE